MIKGNKHFEVFIAFKFFCIFNKEDINILQAKENLRFEELHLINFHS